MLLAGYYVIALPLAAVISGITMEIAFGVMNRRWFRPKLFDTKVLKQLLIIAIPLLPNFLIYWVFNSCDKVMITNIIGIGASGIYSVGSKLGHTSQLIYTAFAGGWQYFAFSTMNEENQVESNSRIFEYLGILSFIATGFICAWSFPIFQLLFRVDYLQGYIVAPYLFFAPLLQMLFQVAANQFIVVKKTWPNLFILISGAIINIIVNLVLIPVLGIEGAALATLFGYIVSDIICVIVLCHMKLMVVSSSLIIASLSMVVYMVTWRLRFSDNVLIGMILAIVFTLFMAYLYRREIASIVRLVKNGKEKA
jgi:O-antigen/teichoic acid export membrane protein